MDNRNNNQPRFIDALTDPAGCFDAPADVAEMTQWSTAKRRAVLERWKFYAQYAGEADGSATDTVTLKAVAMAQAHLDAEQRSDQKTASEAHAGGANPTVAAHKVAGVCATQMHAQSLLDQLREVGLDAGALHVLGPDDKAQLEVPREALVADTGRTVAAGAILGVAGAASIAAVLATPLAGALVASAIGGVLGGGAGAAAAMTLSDQDFRELALEALEDGLWVVVAETGNVGQALDVQEVIADSMAVRAIDQSGAVHEQGRISTAS